MGKAINRLNAFAQGKWIRRILFLLTIIFVGNYIFSHFDWETIKKISIDPFWLSLAVLVNFVYILIYASLWHIITHINNSVIPFPDAIAVWLFSNFGKYLPLKIAGVGYRITTYHQRSSKGYGEIGQLCYIEYIASLLGGFVVVFTLLFFLDKETFISKHIIYLYIVCAIVLSFLLLPPVQNKLLKIGMSVLKNETMLVNTNALNIFTLVIAYAVAWVILGTTLFFLTSAVYPDVEPGDWLRITLVYVLAGIAGMISVFAPSGIGVREGILIFGMQTFIPAPVAVFITLLARLMSMGVDGIGIIAGFIYLERMKNQSGSPRF